MSNSPISSSRIDSKDESWLLLLSDPSAEKAKMRSKLVFFSCCTLMTMIPAIAALVLYPLGQVFAALISLILAGAGLAGGFCLYVNRMLRPTHHIATAIERFRRGDSAVRCPEKAPGLLGLLGLLGERVNLFLSQIQEGRKELMRVAPHIDIIPTTSPGACSAVPRISSCASSVTACCGSYAVPARKSRAATETTGRTSSTPTISPSPWPTSMSSARSSLNTGSVTVSSARTAHPAG